MSDEEPDYMSEDFLKTCTSVDVRPGLQFRRETERRHRLERQREEQAERHRVQNRPRHQLEAEHRDRALDQPIDSSNKGFALLQKMGYKPGMAIGKQGDGRTEPIRPEVKQGRGGLGREAALQAVQRRKQEIRARAAERRERATSAAEFRRRLADKMADRHVTADLMKSQRVCQQLDTKIGVDAPADAWFWPPPLADENAEEEADGEEEEPLPFSPSEQLEMLTDYLRRSHLYCIWCGCAYDDGDDLKENCPGSTRDDH
ncbi:G patch domain-containing protein 11-like [Pollicipes pollicipes]|uniref:G patch domain-containing protein 11-like n=1 Tax=Pollicipes pollicipes TaxID=41117 RepID=UPI001884DACC|nr:G patch domain-containing protein 11-like [Pollicipes pollicipes]XP_037091029.1 G patch domain-containing protein 11-like [Pollicipes pollicipes]XP_037091036.1 G patch domain-containing protein 11-like [Pollicipes pollicipes]XP_037091043.1 G patch domain-containing protein 11-like [Pollicipes pollicipes]XP_037091051.1 G patch domain-containing protein 11-like [Pollicipes pollicipes]